MLPVPSTFNPNSLCIACFSCLHMGVSLESYELQPILLFFPHFIIIHLSFSSSLSHPFHILTEVQKICSSLSLALPMRHPSFTPMAPYLLLTLWGSTFPSPTIALTHSLRETWFYGGYQIEIILLLQNWNNTQTAKQRVG